MIYFQLFYTFFKIGLFSFGGGYAILSLIQKDVVENFGWITTSEFTEVDDENYIYVVMPLALKDI